ncbi:DUF285 domain-containing protein [bacterium]|nr:DUF285 domain-containing protein [bacterium]
MWKSVVLLFFVALFLGCGDKTDDPYSVEKGSLNQPCRDDGSCNEGLHCQNNICLKDEVPDEDNEVVELTPDEDETVDEIIDNIIEDSDLTDEDIIPLPPGFVSLWKTDNPPQTGTNSDDNQIALPLVENGVYDFIVQWGDESQDTITSWNSPKRLHTYSEPGEYQIVITGTVKGWSFNNEGDKDKIEEIQQWGPFSFGNTSGHFYGCFHLIISALDIPDLSDTTTLENSFRENQSLKMVPSMNGWNTSTITTMSHLFFKSPPFNQDISSWDVSNVTDMSYLFVGNSQFNQNISNWNTTKVTNMSHLFEGASQFNQDISDWDVSNVTDMSYLFSRATSFNQDLSKWNTSKVTDMSYLFADTGKFNQNISTWNISEVTTISHIFHQAILFNQDISKWDTSKVTDMSYAFSYAVFNQDISKWNVGNVTDMAHLFAYNKVFNHDIGSWDVSQVIKMTSLFTGDAAFNQDISAWDVAKVEDMNELFADAILFDQDLSAWNPISVTTMWGIFYGMALSTANYDALLISWEGKAIQDRVNFGGGNCKYSAGAAAEARARLVNDHHWYMIDGGEE